MDIRLSIVIPTYNYARFLPRAIDSVLEQSVQPLEIIVADDGSTDETPKVVRQYANKIKYYQLEHCGVYSVRQKMLSQLKGDWFFNLDADNWIQTDFLELMMDVVKANCEDDTFAFVYPDMELFGDRSGSVHRPDYDPQLLKLRNYIDMNSIIRTRAARRFGFDPAFNSGQGDYDFFLTLAKHGYRGLRVPSAVLHYRVHQDSISSSVRRNKQQRSITKKIVKKHRDYFTPKEAGSALAESKNRMLVTLINRRSPLAGFRNRLSDWVLFARIGWRHAEFKRQTHYCFQPKNFFGKDEKKLDLFYLFRDTDERRSLIRKVTGESKIGLNREQLFGFDSLREKNKTLDCNLRYSREITTVSALWSFADRRFAPKDGLGWGDLYSVWCHLGHMSRSRVILATSDNTGLPAARFKELGFLTTPLVYISIGLPERLTAMGKIDPKRFIRYQKRLGKIERFITYGYAEAKWLQDWLGEPDKVSFVPFGVDTLKWFPEDIPDSGPDILSIGFDPKRDFALLAEYAIRHPDINVCLITGHEWASLLGSLPPNMELKIQLSIEEVKQLIAVSKIVVLPVKENTYSGATTTLLQCLAMGKAVAVSQTGAIKDGYGFIDKINLRWLEPGSLQSLESVADNLLNDEIQRKSLGKAAREHVKASLSWDRYVEQLLSVIKDVERKV